MSTTRVQQRTDLADCHYQEAVGRLKMLLTDSGSVSGRGSDAGSVCSRRSRSCTVPPEERDFRPEVRSYRSEANVFRSEASAFRPVAGLRPDVSNYLSEAANFRPEMSHFRQDLSPVRPRSAMSVMAYQPRRHEGLGFGSASVRAASPLSFRSARPLAAARDAVDSGGGRPELDTSGGEMSASDRSQIFELRQFAQRQEELNRQLEQENALLREMTDELRRYVRQLVAENGTLADDLRSRVSEERAAVDAADGSDARLEVCRAEVERLSKQIVEHEEQLNAVHQQQLEQVQAERSQLADTVRQLQASLEETKRELSQANQKVMLTQRTAEETQKALADAKETTTKLRRELEAKDRRADQLQMEHERQLMAAREQAEDAVRDTFQKLRQQLDTQADRIAELEAAEQRHKRQEDELKVELKRQQHEAAQARLDADSAAQRYRRELETLQQRPQIVNSEESGSDRLLLELAAVRRQLAASEEQLVAAQRDRGRLQQQIKLLDRRPPAGQPLDTVDSSFVRGGKVKPQPDRRSQSMPTAPRSSAGPRITTRERSASPKTSVITEYQIISKPDGTDDSPKKQPRKTSTGTHFQLQSTKTSDKAGGQTQSPKHRVVKAGDRDPQETDSVPRKTSTAQYVEEVWEDTPPKTVEYVEEVWEEEVVPADEGGGAAGTDAKKTVQTATKESTPQSKSVVRLDGRADGKGKSDKEEENVKKAMESAQKLDGAASATEREKGQVRAADKSTAQSAGSAGDKTIVNPAEQARMMARPADEDKASGKPAEQVKTTVKPADTGKATVKPAAQGSSGQQPPEAKQEAQKPRQPPVPTQATKTEAAEKK